MFLPYCILSLVFSYTVIIYVSSLFRLADLLPFLSFTTYTLYSVTCICLGLAYGLLLILPYTFSCLACSFMFWLAYHLHFFMLIFSTLQIIFTFSSNIFCRYENSLHL